MPLRLAALCLSAGGAGVAQEDGSAAKPNILVIWGDDIGQFNVSAYNNGMMGYRTPNIDRIAEEGALFTDWYGQQSCTAGRAAFITGQSPIRTGLTKVGLPGAPEGMKVEDPTIAGLLRPLGYVTGQFGKNHLGDRDEMLPTNNGFDQFFGNLYHLNAEEEPENPDYPKGPAFKEQFGPRGVIRLVAPMPDGRPADRGHRPARPGSAWRRSTRRSPPRRWPSWTRRMRTASRSSCGGTPPACTSSPTSSRSRRARPASAIYADGMVEHDGQVGQLLDKLDELGIADNTIVMYSTDNGAETFTWPDGGTTMFRGEKNTNWEGGYRVPTLIRWPGVIKPGTVVNDIAAHEDMLTTLLAAAGEPDIKQELLTGKQVGDRTYKVHLDGYDLMPALKGEADWPRREFLYWTDDGSVAALRYDNWKITFLEQEAHGLRRLAGRRSRSCAPRRSPICAWIPSSAPRRRTPWATSAGIIDRMFLMPRRRPSSATGCRASASSRRARSPAASTSSG